MIDRLILTVVIALIIFIIYQLTGKFHLLDGILIAWAILYLEPYVKSYFADEDETPETPNVPTAATSTSTATTATDNPAVPTTP